MLTFIKISDVHVQSIVLSGIKLLDSKGENIDSRDEFVTLKICFSPVITVENAK